MLVQNAKVRKSTCTGNKSQLTVGTSVVGWWLGLTEGGDEGDAVVGVWVGDNEGGAVVGVWVGDNEGDAVIGLPVG